MMKISNRNKITIVFCVSLLTLGVIPTVYAKYAKQGNAGDTARIAAFNVSYDNTGTSTFSDSFTISLDPTNVKSTEYTFQLSNSSEVSVQMTATLELVGNLPLTVTCKNNIEVIAIDNKGVDKRYIWTDNLDNTTQTYTIIVSWKADDISKSYIYANGVETAYLTVEVTQID